MADSIKNIPDAFILPPSAKERFLPLSLPLSSSLTNSGIQLAGISTVYEPYEMSRSNPPCHVLIFSISGEAKVITNEFEQPLNPGELLISPIHVPHCYRAGKEWQIAWFHLDDVPRWSFLKEMPVQIRPSLTLPRLLWAMEGLLEESTLSDTDGNTATGSFANLILFYLERELEVHESRIQREVRDQLRRLWMRVNAHPQHDWSIDELSREMKCSQAQLYRLTSMYYGKTPMGMVSHLRMECAKEFLRGTSYNLDHIAFLVGYNTSFALSRAFKSHTGQSPRDFRNENR